MVDIGMVAAQIGLSSMSRGEAKNIIFGNKGELAEQFVGQQLRACQAPLSEPLLYYWQTTGGRQGEIDYIIQHGNRVVPVEVKSGVTYILKSLHQFMANKNLDYAVRCNLSQPVWIERTGVKNSAPVLTGNFGKGHLKEISKKAGLTMHQARIAVKEIYLTIAEKLGHHRAESSFAYIGK